jgi:hypothetical protein
MDFPCKFFLGGEGKFVFLSSNGKAQGALLLFLSSNGKAQGALLLFLSSLEGGKDYFFHFALFPNVFLWCSL